MRTKAQKNTNTHCIALPMHNHSPVGIPLGVRVGTAGHELGVRYQRIRPPHHDVAADGVVGSEVLHAGCVLVLDHISVDVLAHGPVSYFVADKILANVLLEQ
jgi:hypothetical protein